MRRPALRWPQIRDGGWALWASGLCWTVMFTAFMVALTLTTVANVLVTMALAPLLTAMIARIVLGHRLPARTWAAIFIAGGGIAWMYGHELGDAEASQGLGVTLALCVPVAAAANWTMLQHAQHDTAGRDMLPAVLIGAVLSALVTLPFAWPFAGSLRDVGWLALLGIVQLAVPCMLLVAVARALPAPEIALLGLLEVVFGVAWAWLGAGEVPSPSVLGGGALVLCALAADQALSLRRVPRV